MNIWLEGLYMERMRDAENENIGQEDESLAEEQEELQDTTANGRRLKNGTRVNSTGNQTSNPA